MYLLRRIEKFLERNAMRPTRFGREAVGDPRFVFDLREGREPLEQTVLRVHAWLDREEDEEREAERRDDPSCRLRPQAEDELRRLVRASFAGFDGHFQIEDIESRSWASVTFSGERHTLRLRLRGDEAAAAADAFLGGLTDREFDLDGHVIADIAIVSDERDARGTTVRLGMEVLTVEAS